MNYCGINFLAVIVAAFLANALGGLWYSPLMFQKKWMELLGIDAAKAEEMKVGMGKAFAASLLSELVMSSMLAVIMVFLPGMSLLNGMAAGLLVWMGFVLPTGGLNYLFQGKPFKLYIIDMGYHAAALMIMGGVLGMWR